MSEVLDDFVDISSWTAVASGLAHLDLSVENAEGRRALRLDYDFHGGGGFVVARKVFARPMPESYALSFAIRGAAPANRLELKLADPSGRNVWWRHWDAFALSQEWSPVAVPSREIEFAWGPAGGGTMSRLGAVELVIAAGPGGAGTVWISDLRLEDRTYRSTPSASASSETAGHEAALVLDGKHDTSWRSAARAAPQWLEIDFKEPREYGGLVVTWMRELAPRSFRVELSDDGASWKTCHTAEADGVERSWIYLPGTSSRFLRLALEPGSAAGAGIAEIEVQSFEFSRSINAFFEHVARDQPRGLHPRWLAGEQSYWTCVGVADGVTSALINEEGMVEVDRGQWSIEPFVHLDGHLLSWADAETSQTLEDGWIPVPSSVWKVDEIALRTTAFAARRGGTVVLYLRYRIENRGTRARRGKLFAAIRPFQVNPPWQAFGELGGMRKIEAIAWDGRRVRVDGTREVLPLDEPSGFGAAAFEHGEITSALARGELPARDEVSDSFGYASAALAFDFDLAAAATRDVYLAVPFGVADAGAEPSDVRGELELERVLADWRRRLGAVAIDLPSSAAEHAAVARTAAAHILINRDGPALQPGPRRYTRSWIRDGAVMASALLRLGRNDEALEFVRWYAGYQAEDGNVPCCVDHNGPDWLVEHDSHGELIFAVAECFRFTRDREFLAELWPAARKAADYLDGLRAKRLGPEYETPELLQRRGLLPESASHEGYLAHPVHAYWDDFWALQGYRDAAAIAAWLGEERDSRRFIESHDAMRADVRASIRRVIEERRIDYVPGSVEWADFDPTATAVAVALLGALDDLPRTPLERGFDEYLAGYRRRRRGEIDWNNYSAYEIRVIGALVHLGRRDDAAELTDFMLSDRRPRPWNQWPEISWRDVRSPGHIGDVPHTWIGAEYVLAFRTMLAYETSDALVLGAGIPADWLDGGAEVGVSGLPTYYGRLDLRLRREENTLAVSLAGDLEIPSGGIVLRPPLPAALVAVEVNGAAVHTFDASSATIQACPASVVLRCG